VIYTKGQGEVMKYDKAIVGLYNIEPQYKNMAQDKIKMYHDLKCDLTEPYNGLEHKKYDIVYASSIFTFTDKSYTPVNAICGGTGFDIKSKLPVEIEKMKPRKNYGFCSRGCNNKCPWCVVPEKEGKAKPECDIYDIWDGESKDLMLWDNNILQLPDHFKLIAEQVHKHRELKIDFNQGLDIRLITKEIAELMSTKYMRHAAYHFAFDTSKIDQLVIDKVKILKGFEINQNIFYVLVGFPSKDIKTAKEDIQDAVYRLNLLRSLGQRAMVMRYKKIYDDQPETLINVNNEKLYMALANWGSSHGQFAKTEFYKDYLNGDRGSGYKPYFKEIGLVG